MAIENQPPTSDVLIIGGGPAGLSAALTLYRALHTCTIFDSAAPRNTWSTPLRLTNTWEGGRNDDFLAASRKELQNSGLVDFVAAKIVRAERKEPAAAAAEEGDSAWFEVEDETGRKWRGRTVCLAQGVGEVHPEIEGYEELYTKSILPCMFQFGYELAGARSAGLLAVQGLANPHFALKLADDGHKFAERFTIYTDGNAELASQLAPQLSAADPRMRVDDRKIARLRPGTEGGGGGVILEFEGGGAAAEAFLVHRPLTRLDRALGDMLGVEYDPLGNVRVAPPFNQTRAPGVYAAGDCATPMKIVPSAMAMGAYAGAGLARELPRRVTGNGCARPKGT